MPVSKPSLAEETLDEYVPIYPDFVTTGMATEIEDLLAEFEEFQKQEKKMYSCSR